MGLGRPVRDELSSPAPMAAVDGEMGVWAREGDRGSFYRRHGFETKQTRTQGRSIRPGRATARWRGSATPSAACHTGASAGARGVWRRRQGGAVLAQPVGAGWYWPRARRVAGLVAPAAGVVQGKQRREERDAVGGNFVISSTFKISSVNSIFLPLLGLK